MPEPAVSKHAPKARLETLDAQTDARHKKDEALTAGDEARRLREAAGRAKPNVRTSKSTIRGTRTALAQERGRGSVAPTGLQRPAEI